MGFGKVSLIILLGAILISHLTESKNTIVYPIVRFPLTPVPNGLTTSLTLGTPSRTLTLFLDTINEGLRVFLHNTTNFDVPTSGDWSSLSSAYCKKAMRCDTPGSQTMFSYYDCSESSSDLQRAQFYTYAFPYKFAFSTTTLETAVCERRAEGTDVVALKLDNGDTFSGVQNISDVPIKFVATIFSCVGRNNAMLPHHHVLQDPIQFFHINNEPNSTPQPVHGFFGITGQPCRQPTVLQRLLSASPGLDTVQLDLTSDHPELRLVSAQSLEGQNIVWSEPQQPIHTVAGMFQLECYHPTLCGIDLGFNESSHWSVLVNPTVSCLALPTPLWDALVAWIPVECSYSAQPLCTLRSDVTPSALPSLSLALHPPLVTFQNAMSSSIVLPLEHFVTPNRTLCIDRLPTILDDYGDPFLSQPMIVLSAIHLGRKSTRHQRSAVHIASAFFNSTHVILCLSGLNHFVASFNTANQSVGFTPLYSAQNTSKGICNPRASCVGQQVYFEPRNSCTDVDCSQWFFKVLNLQTRVCEFSFGAITTLLVCIASLLALNVYSEWLYLKVLRYAKTQAR